MSRLEQLWVTVTYGDGEEIEAAAPFREVNPEGLDVYAVALARPIYPNRGDQIQVDVLPSQARLEIERVCL
jgi:hypothetical protein